MLNEIFRDNWIIEQHRNGPLGKYGDRLAQELIAAGYCRADLRRRFGVVSDFNRWLQRKGLKLSELSPSNIEAFCRYRKRKISDFYRTGDHATLQRLLSILRNDKVIPEIQVKPRWRIEIRRCVAAFQAHLEHEKGFSAGAVRRYLNCICQFLQERFGKGVVCLLKLSAADISAYLRKRGRIWSPKHLQLVASVLRAFLRFAFINGDTQQDLSGCIPAIPSWRGKHLPEFLDQREVLNLLRSCDRKTRSGIRTYALILLMVRLGLRASEVLYLSLDDVDWRAGTITISGKGLKEATLPLPEDVGRALIAYIKRARPRVCCRRLFLTARAPHGALANASCVSCIVHRALIKAQLNPGRKGAHLLRYTAATECLRQGATLPEVGELLRHRSIDTTVIYTKVDLNRLRTLSLPWPAA